MRKHPQALMIPVYGLLRKWDRHPTEGLPPEALDQFAASYSPEVLSRIVAALRWSQENPRYDFKRMVPGVKYTNATILEYLQKLLVQLETFTTDPATGVPSDVSAAPGCNDEGVPSEVSEAAGGANPGEEEA